MGIFVKTDIRYILCQILPILIIDPILYVYMHLETLKIQLKSAWMDPTSKCMYHLSGYKYKITL